MYSRVYVEITNTCNMNCSFCHGHSRPPRRMSEDEFERILKSLSGVTGYIYYHLMGEPLTHPDLPKLLKTANARGFKSVITTNGTLLSRRRDELLSSPIHKISISLHSFEDGDTERFERYISEVASFVGEAAEKGIIVVLRLWNRGGRDEKNVETLSLLRSRLDGEWAENSRGIKIREKLFLEYGDRFEWPDENAPVCSDEVFCYGMRDHFGILCDGTVVPCCLDSEGAINLGNIFREDINEILASDRVRAIARGFERRRPSEDMCRRCGYATRFNKG